MNHKITLSCSDLSSTTEKKSIPTGNTSLFTIFLTLLLSLALNVSVWGQSASATWALTSNGDPVSVGNVTATSIVRGNGSIGSYNANGVFSDIWNSGFDSTKFYEYSVTPNSGNSLTVSAISFYYSVSSGSMDFTVSYSLDNFASSTSIGGVSAFSNTTSNLQFAPAITPITVGSGVTLKVRVYGYGATGSNRTFRNRNFVISGSTYSCTAPSLSSQPDNKTITYGANADFAVVASGTGPLTYQWQVDTDGAGPGVFTNIALSGIYANTDSNEATLEIAKPTVAMSGYLYRVVVTGACAPAATSTVVTLTVNAKVITVTPDAGQSKIYGQANPTYTYTNSPALESGDSFTGVLSREIGESVASSPYAYTLGTLSAGANYILSLGGVNTFSISPLVVSVTAEAKSKTYGDVDPALTFVSSPAVGFVLPNGDAISFIGALSRAVGQDVGTYLISQNTVVNSNYTITYVPANFEITQRPITVKADTKSKVYGATDPVLTYQITVGSLAYSDAFTGALTRVAGETVLGSPYAILQGSLALSTNYTLTYTGANLTITAAPVNSSVSVDVSTVHYSDQVTFTATIVGGAPLVDGGPQAAVSATFKVGTQTIGTADFEVSGFDIVATGTYAMLEPIPFGTLPTGQMAPGSKIVTAVINSPDTNFAISNLSPTTSLLITKENAVVNYIGNEITATQSTTNLTATLDLRVSVQDIADNYRGDIKKATVSFELDGTEIMEPTLISNLVDPYTGIISKSHQVTLTKNTDSETFTLKVLVNNYYIGNDETVITVYKPTGDFITGGGHIIPTASEGTMPSTVGTKTNFGFNVKFNKKGTNLQGKLNFIWRSAGKIYQAKSNATDALGVDIANPNAKLATFTSKCNLTDITDPLNPISLGGNLKMHVSMTDKGEPGVNDDIAFTLWDDNTLMYSSNWTGTATAKMVLNGGNIVVHSGFNSGVVTETARTDQTNIATTNVTAVEALPEETELGIFTVSAYPNPSKDYFRLQLNGVNSSDTVELNVFDVNGRHVFHKKGRAYDEYQFGEQLKLGVYFLEVRVGESSERLKVIKQ